MAIPPESFREVQGAARPWLTVIDKPFYPDSLDSAKSLYGAVLDRFAELANETDSTADLLREIQDEPRELRTQLLRVFRRYASPTTSVEMLKRKQRTEQIISEYGESFRAVEEIQVNLASRPSPDEAIAALLDEYTDRAAAGYALTEAFFIWFDAEFGEEGWTIQGPVRAGKDVDLQSVFDGFPRPTKADIFIRDPEGVPRVVGFARYDSDRGGSQEDDRTEGNFNHLQEVLLYADEHELSLKVLFLNDGPGLTLGSMWNDYSHLEEFDPARTLVTTLKMAQAGRVSLEWLNS